MKARGFVHKYGNNVDTDVIIPARYLNTANHKEEIMLILMLLFQQDI